MTSLEITLSEPLKTFMEQQIAAGGYRNPSEYVQALLRDVFKAQQRAEIEAQLLVGIEEVERGEARELTELDWERLHAAVDERSHKP